MKADGRTKGKLRDKVVQRSGKHATVLLGAPTHILQAVQHKEQR